MKKALSVKPEKDRLINILDEIKKGEIKIPIFQRDFVWNENQMLELFDSIEKGYPIGSLLFWKPEDIYKYGEQFGPFVITQKAKEIKYVLDGFQRLSTLFGVLTNPKHFNKITNKAEIKKYEIFYDLEKEEYTYTTNKTNKAYLIPLFALINTFDILDYFDDLRLKISNKELSDKYIERARKLATIFVDYEIPYIDIRGGDIKGSVDIFSRVNSAGTKLSKDWMLSALSHKEDFLLSDKITELLIELEKYNFQDINRDIILHCIETSTGKIYFDTKIEKIAERDDFPIITEETFVNIITAIKFLRNNFNIIESRLLPYNTQLVFLTEFFRLNKYPTNEEKNELINWFWITTYSNYFTIYSLSKQRKAFLYFKEFALRKRKNAIYNNDKEQIFTTYPFTDKINFGSVRSKALILFMLNVAYKNTNYQDYTPELEIRYINTKIRNFASAVFFQKNDNRIPSEYIQKRNDASFVLVNNFENKKEFFLNIDNVNNNNFLDLRINIIKELEQHFVKGLNLIYNTDE